MRVANTTMSMERRLKEWVRSTRELLEAFCRRGAVDIDAIIEMLNEVYDVVDDQREEKFREAFEALDAALEPRC